MKGNFLTGKKEKMGVYIGLRLKVNTVWKAKYLKLVDENDSTLKFWQEIYDNLGKLVEIHEKYPLDKGHVKLSDNDN